VQLLPLFLLWIVAARHLDRLLGIGSRGFLYATAILVGVLALSPIMAAPG
jgi:hypothetical protein